MNKNGIQFVARIVVFAMLVALLPLNVFSYDNGDIFFMYARDNYSNAGANDPYGESYAVDVDEDGNDVLYKANAEHYGGGGWDMETYSGTENINLYTGLSEIGQGALYVLNDSVQGYYTTVTLHFIADAHKAFYSALVTYDGGQTDDVLVYDSTETFIHNGETWEGWGHIAEAEIGTYPNLESVKIYISDGHYWGTYGSMYATSYKIEGTVEGYVPPTPTIAPTVDPAQPTATPSPTPTPEPTSTPDPDTSFYIWAHQWKNEQDGWGFGTSSKSGGDWGYGPMIFLGANQDVVFTSNNFSGRTVDIYAENVYYPNAAAAYAEVTYIENGNTVTTDSVLYYGSAETGRANYPLNTGDVYSAYIGRYTNVQSVRVFALENETEVRGINVAYITDPNATPVPTATPAPTASPTPEGYATAAPTATPKPTPKDGEAAKIGDTFNIYSNPQSPWNKQGVSYIWAFAPDAYAQNYSYARTFTNYFDSGDGIVHEPFEGYLDGFNTTVSIKHCAFKGHSDLAAVVKYMENGEIKYSPAFRFTGYHVSARQSEDDWTETLYNIGTYPNVISVNVYHIMDGTAPIQDWVQFDVVGEAGEAVIPDGYYIETKVLPNEMSGKPMATPCPTAFPAKEGPTMVPLVTPAPLGEGDVISLGNDTSFVLYPANRDGWSYSGENSNTADFMNRNNGKSVISLAAGSNVSRSSNYLVDVSGAAGTTMTYTPKHGLLQGVDTLISVPAWQLNNLGSNIEYTVVYDSGQSETNDIEYIAKWNGSNAFMLELGTYYSIESVTLRTKNSSAATFVPVIFTVVNEYPEYDVVSFDKKVYTPKNTPTVTPAAISVLPAKNVESTVYLNEICPTNTTGFIDKNGAASDWIELYNNGDEDVDISGYGLTDNINKPFKWVFPQGITVPANGYLVVVASGNNAIIDGELHTNFSISKAGETIMLSTSDGGVVSIIDLPTVESNKSMSRYPDGSNNLKVTNQTPGETNDNAEIISSFVTKPEFSAESGFYTEPFELTISSQSGTVYYTLDGSDPTTSSTVYTSPVNIVNRTNEDNILSAITYETCSFVPSVKIDKSMVIRAVSIDDNGNASDVVTKSYFVDFDMADDFSNVAVLSVVTDADNLYDDESGIFTHIASDIDGREWEREAHLDMFEGDGSLVIDQNVGIRVRGFGSRSQMQKALNFYARSDYGKKYFEYPIFGDDCKSFENGKTIDTFKSFCIRTGNQNASTYRYFDGALQAISEGLGNAWQASRPCVVFINGEYWGQYYIQERVSVDYIEEHYGIPDNDVILLKNHEVKGDGIASDKELYDSEKDWLANTDFSIEENYRQLEQKYDVENMMLYYAANLSTMNRDWGGYNFACWRSRNVTDEPYQDGKWRFLMYDMDISYHGENADLAIDFLTAGGVHSYALAMQSNPSLRRRFANAILEVQSGAYDPQRVFRSLTYWDDELRPLIPDMVTRWGLSYDYYNGSLSGLYNRIATRDTYYIENLKNHFGFTGAYTYLNVKVNDASCGTVYVNSLKPDFTKGSYTGRYFTDLTSTLTAVPYDGYKFDHWEMSEGTALSSDTDDVTFVSINENGSMVKAVFLPVAEGEDVIKIYTAEDLINVANNKSGNYVLENDIDMSGISFTAIGTKADNFMGIFDGQGHVIRNITINNTAQGQGVFGYTSDSAVIRNLGAENITINGGKNVGGIVGNNNGLIENCYSTGTLNGASTVGGIAGNNVSGTVKDCFSAAAINSESTSSGGGITGKTENEGNVENCYSLVNPVGKAEGTTDELTRIATLYELYDGTVTALLGGNWIQGVSYPVFKSGEATLLIEENSVVLNTTAGVLGKIMICNYNENGLLTEIAIRDVLTSVSITIPETMTGTIKAFLVTDTENIMPLSNCTD